MLANELLVVSNSHLNGLNPSKEVKQKL